MAAVPRAAVIGGGLAGLAAAKALLNHGVACTLLDLGERGVGGRVSSRQLEMGKQGLPLSFDDGTQFFLAASPDFRAEVASWAAAGAAAEWRGRHGRITADGAFELHQPGPSSGSSDSSNGSGSSSSSGRGRGGIHGRDGSETRWVGVPTNAAIPQHMAHSLLAQHGQQAQQGQQGRPLFELLSGWAVRSMERVGGGCGCGSGRSRWRLRGSRVGADASLAPAPAPEGPEQEDLGTFEAAILADAAPLLPGSVGAVEGLEAASPSLAHLARSVRDVAAAAQPRLVLSVAFAAPLVGVPFDFATFEQAGGSGAARSCDGCGCGACGPGFGGAFHLVACDSSKPGRPFGTFGTSAASSTGGGGGGTAAPQCWAAVTTAARAEQLLDRFGGGRHAPFTPERQAAVAEELLADFRDVMAPFVQGFALPQPAYTQVQRWSRAFVTEPLGAEFLLLPAQKVALCGDVAIGSGVENAWRSGRAAGDAVGRMLRAAGAAPSS